jgi:DNA-binding transcriptional ArsR family regulator
MLRLHFSATDLARVRLRGTLGPVAETVLALRALGSPRDAALLGEWRRRVGRRLAPAAAAIAGYADLLPVVAGAPTVEQGMAVVRRAGSDRLARLMATSYDVALGPHWPAMRAYLDAERATRARILADAGVAGLFATLHPGLSWGEPVLAVAGPGPGSGPASGPAPGPASVPGPGLPVDLELGGRGLEVVPSVFCRGEPQVLIDRAANPGPVVLIYPAVADVATAARLWQPSPEAVADGLSHLLGQTRAGVLTAVADGCTTTELARRLGISVAGASQHASVLRRAGLILSTRQGNAVLHTLTRLGAALVDGWLAPAP